MASRYEFERNIHCPKCGHLLTPSTRVGFAICAREYVHVRDQWLPRGCGKLFQVDETNMKPIGSGERSDVEEKTT